MRRVIIIRKDLHLKAGKLAAMCMHCAEAYWTNLLKNGQITDNEFQKLSCVSLMTDKGGVPHYQFYLHPKLNEMSEKAFNDGEKFFVTERENPRKTLSITVEIQKDIWGGYVNGIFTKTICEAKNLNQLNAKALPVIEELGLVEGVDWGYINDCCLTDLTPENEDGTTTIGMWFKPLDDETAHKISRKFKLYGAFDK